MKAKVARRLGTAVGVAAGGVGAAVWTDAAPALMLVFISVLLAVLSVLAVLVWVLAADGPTGRLATLIRAVKGTPAGESVPPTAERGRRWRAYTR